MSCGERLSAELRQRGFRVTPQRSVILETIAHGEGHQSAQEVFLEAAKRLPGLNIATVYRTLETLHQAGMVDLFSTTADSVRFELHDADRPHHHLHCRACGNVLDLPHRFVEGVAEQLRQECGFALDSAHLTLVGLCAACASRQSVGTDDKGG
jgi:Fur family ferric uptake transcriptional regulator